MTDDTMALRTLLEKSPDADFLPDMIGFAADRLMELEVAGLTGGAHGERSGRRINQRNCYRDRAWETRAGSGAACRKFASLGAPEGQEPRPG